MIKFIDLFAGTGGLRLGFEQAMQKFGITPFCVKSAEIDRAACETYEFNFSENPYCDVRGLNDLDPFDVLLAGFPCQAFSSAGKQQGFQDTRGTLFFDVARLVSKHKPKLCILENVRGLLSHDGGKTFNVIKKTFHELGYFFDYRVLNSSNFGVPQNRVRVYMLAVRDFFPTLSIDSDVGASDSHKFKKISVNKNLFQKNDYSILKDVLEVSPSEKYDCSIGFQNKLMMALNGELNKLHGLRLIDSRKGHSLHSWSLGLKGECTPNEILFMNLLLMNRRKKIFGIHQDGKALSKRQISTFYKFNDIDDVIFSLLEKGYIKINNGLYNLVAGNMSFEVFKFLDPNSVSITLTASDSNRLGIYFNNRIRRITPRECARIQGYPDEYIIHPNDAAAYKQLGNAVSVPVVREIISDFILHNRSKIFN